MDSIEKVIGIVLVFAIIIVISFIIGDISRMVFYPKGGFKKFIFNSMKKLFS